MNEARFPCERLPDDPAVARLLGLYDQRQAGLLMQRTKVRSGRITALQLRTLAGLALKYTPSYPLHVTTRQDVELHGVRPSDVPAVQRAIHAIGLTTVGACGDTLRNITTCPGNGLCPGSFDVTPVADAIEACAGSLPWILALPRKFKISISGCETACARPWINDVGLVARNDGTFRAILAGSLGPHPGAGIALYESLKPAEVVPLVTAALHLFNAEGDRKNRSRARLRHARERIGDDTFRERLDALFHEQVGSTNSSRPFGTQKASSDTSAPVRLHLPLGDIEPELALELADALEKAEAIMQIGIEHDLLLYGETVPVLSPALKALSDSPTIVACPGSTWCKRGIVDSRGAAQRIAGTLFDNLGLAVSISGCPNNCSHAAVADIGLAGRIGTRDGSRVECFRLFAGGGKGRTPVLARELHTAVPADRVHLAVSWLVEEYHGSVGRDTGSFADFVARENGRLAHALEQRFG